MTVLYDIEMYKNMFLIVFYHVEGKKYYSFEISQFKDERGELWSFLRNVELMIAFNNLAYDYPILHLLIAELMKDFNITAYQLVTKLMMKSTEIINSKKRVFKPLKQIIKQIDLFKIHHFDNVAKATSLKALQFVFKKLRIRELPYPPNSMLTLEQSINVRDYCHDDVDTLLDLYNESIEAIKLRIELSSIYGINMNNMNDPQMGETILVKAMKNATGKSYLGQTKRASITIKDIIFPYIKFYTSEFNAIYNWFNNKVITETKGVFNGLELSEVDSLQPYINTSKEMIKKGKLTIVNIVFNGFQFDFGAGGIHGSVEPSYHEETPDIVILDIDVSSFYPRLGIENKIYPEHLSQVFYDVYLSIYQERKKYPKGSAKNGALKLALNGAYGKSNSEFSELYDPQYTMATTINGQLTLCMLSEMLSLLPSIVILQANTDGITIKFERKYLLAVKHICECWEKITRLELEYARYTKLVIRDVNSYLGVKQDGKIKRIGAFEYKKEMHQNHSMMIIPKAVEAFFLYGTSVEEFIFNHNDIWDFFKRVKLPKIYKLVLRQGENSDLDVNIQRLTRYYVSKNGYTLLKLMPPLKDKVKVREANIESGYLCTIVNDVTDNELEYMKQNLDYEYYIREAYKIINLIKI